MRFKTTVTITGLIVAALLVLAFVHREPAMDKKTPQKKRVSAYYNGIKEKPVYSRSDIRITDKSYRFSPVLQGDRVEHDFFIKNESQVMMEIVQIKSCCGFILTNHTSQIFPGQEGKISILVFTDKFGGQEMRGNIRAVLSGAGQKEFNLELSMSVEKIASFSTHKIILKGSGKKEIEGSAIIVPEEKYMFDITGIKAKKGLHIDYEYSKVLNHGKPEYIVVVKNKQKNKRVYRDMLFLQTDSKVRPELRLRVEGHISE